LTPRPNDSAAFFENDEEPAIEKLPDFSEGPRAKRKREFTRQVIAYGLLALLAIVVIASLFRVGAPKETWDQMKDYLGLIFTALVGLAGSAFGFYFGESRDSLYRSYPRGHLSGDFR
jgi:hypothetical protein